MTRFKTTTWSERGGTMYLTLQNRVLVTLCSGLPLVAVLCAAAAEPPYLVARRAATLSEQRWRASRCRA